MEIKLRPSNSHTWMHCTASPLWVAQKISEGKAKADTETVWNVAGNEAHEWAARLLSSKPPKLETIPKDYRPYVKQYADYCKSLKTKGSVSWVETKFPLFYRPEKDGIIDFICAGQDKISVVDYKHGSGVFVDVEDNPQVAIYGESAIEWLAKGGWEYPEHTPVELTVVQPRYRGEDTIKTWETTVGELHEFSNGIAATAAVIMSAKSVEQLEFVPSENVCRFCPAKHCCPARDAKAFEAMPFDPHELELFENLDMPAIEELGIEQIAAVLAHEDDLITWLKTARAHMMELATTGTDMTPYGLKLVKGREGNRKWKDEDQAAKFLKKRGWGDDEIFPPKIISPSQAEVGIKTAEGLKDKEIKALTDKLTTRSEGKPVLTVLSDKRPALQEDLSQFDVLPDEGDVEE